MKNKKFSGFTLAEVFSPLFNDKRKIAFTLAEVLITLGIIGIVAAMTLPALIQKNKRTELQSGLKTGYSLLQQALQRMNADNGYPVIPANYPLRTFKKEYIKYFDNAIDCDWGGSWSTKNKILCSKSNYNTMSGGKAVNGLFDDGQFVLKNGMLVMIENANNMDLFISIDINGVQKKPNVWGQDVFTFQIMSDGKLLPMGANGTNYTDNSKYCSKNSTFTYNGVGCTQKALTDKSYWNGI